jgi:glycosyltransferase involved in cell wall biosynthesis
LKAYSKANIFVLPSYGETSPITIIEAMASSLPVVASRVGGIPDLIQDGYNGFLVTPGNSLELSEKLDILLNDPSLIKSMGQRSRALATTKFNYLKSYQRMQDLYHSLIA